MNVGVLYYDGFCEFELVLSYMQFRKDNIFSVAKENRIYVSEETQKYVPDKILSEVNPKEIDLFIITGGDPTPLYEDQELIDFIKELDKENKVIAGICGGTELMAKCGILDNKRCTGDSSGLDLEAKYISLFEKAQIINEDVVVDGNVITAMGQAYIEFAIELGKVMKKYKSEKEAKEDYKWLKNIKG